jgi:hypothetical protein
VAGAVFGEGIVLFNIRTDPRCGMGGKNTNDVVLNAAIALSMKASEEVQKAWK